jgi:hypothetical protein
MTLYTVQTKNDPKGPKARNIEAATPADAIKQGGKLMGFYIDPTDPYDQSHLLEAIPNAPIQYATGRTYDTPQVLEIEIEARTTDDYGLEEITATFRDQSRHIAGRVTAILFNDGIGAAVLTEYDAGRYQAI